MDATLAEFERYGYPLPPEAAACVVELERDIARNITAERLRRFIRGYTWTDQRGNQRSEMGLGDGFRSPGRAWPATSGSPKHATRGRDSPRPQREGPGVRAETCLGIFNEVAYYLHFNGVGGNVFGPPQLAELPLNEMPKVIYADTVAVEPAELDEHKVTFKQIPYDVKVY